LARPKFARITRAQRGEYLEPIREQTELAADPQLPERVVRDPKDDDIVALARAERVDAIVSTDRDLLDAGLDEPRILTPRQLLDSLLQGNG
jgi:predicted nucleic acid-binding protein